MAEITFRVEGWVKVKATDSEVQAMYDLDDYYNPYNDKELDFKNLNRLEEVGDRLYKRVCDILGPEFDLDNLEFQGE